MPAGILNIILSTTQILLLLLCNYNLIRTSMADSTADGSVVSSSIQGSVSLLEHVQYTGPLKASIPNTTRLLLLLCCTIVLHCCFVHGDVLVATAQLVDATPLQHISRAPRGDCKALAGV